jgi:hypothetical protein
MASRGAQWTLKCLLKVKNRYHYCNHAKYDLLLPASASMEGPGPSPNLARGSGYYVRLSYSSTKGTHLSKGAMWDQFECAASYDVEDQVSGNGPTSKMAYAGTVIDPLPAPAAFDYTSTSGMASDLVTPEHGRTSCFASRSKHPRINEGNS